ncbi:MAG: glycosyltransferase family 4 protein [Gammaproteobacteria bacterium]|nr:glycosyltransferase family 4 protein [Gammaproteobacteria bacterium]
MAFTFVTYVMLLAGAFGVALLTTPLMRRLALHYVLLDVPNERSAHSVPTPRGGGIAIAAAFFLSLALLLWWGVLPRAAGMALLGGGLLVAVIGAWDDRRHVAPQWRLLAHALAALWALFWLGKDLSLLTAALTLAAIVWLINLYNFMDGIDGLAGAQALCAGLAGGALLWLSGEPGLAMASLALAMSSAGFLVWNWPPAKIFMGDAGSGLLGYSFAVLALASIQSGALSAPIWLILLAPFVLDATLTLLRRVLRGERWYQAHATHLYQRMTQAGYSHKQVTTAVILLNITLLWGLAAWLWRHAEFAAWTVSVAGILGAATWAYLQSRMTIKSI